MNDRPESAADGAPSAPRFSAGTLDLAERALVLTVYLYSIVRAGPSAITDPALGQLLVLSGNLLVVVFVVARRRPDVISTRPWDWLIAVIGTAAPLFARPAEGPRLVPPLAAALVILAGLVLTLATKLTLRRNFSLVPARSDIVARGPYRLVRHPMYAGYVLVHLGLLAYGFVLWNLACYLICWVFLWLRIDREEAVLSETEAYRAYREQVRYRLVWGLA
ncbi:MAG: isoprenylcysteine carboxylmethyltransferase family protein [Kineosporiaceae bacterium]|nr:isoprenylcysteine carboxylmethyltransferase family protein [Kineosporiaceae bacterium]MBK7622271.1 isoprenylcysteine carboxylmethyltransferase family protein [Kineosporiaceae bacterium]MBK8074599.1 isoprenylcysteine carboxylmethyltransferase family protein [Kineosporiaceae bacterium]